MAFLRKEFKRTIKKYESKIIKFLENLEVKVDKLELRVVKLECASKSGLSSHPYADSA